MLKILLCLVSFKLRLVCAHSNSYPRYSQEMLNRLPCTFPGCPRTFKGQRGRMKHIRTEHGMWSISAKSDKVPPPEEHIPVASEPEFRDDDFEDGFANFEPFNRENEPQQPNIVTHPHLRGMLTMLSCASLSLTLQYRWPLWCQWHFYTCRKPPLPSIFWSTRRLDTIYWSSSIFTRWLSVPKGWNVGAEYRFFNGAVGFQGSKIRRR